MTRVLCVLVTFFVTYGCEPRELRDPDYGLKTSQNARGAVHLTKDSPIVRQLLVRQGQRYYQEMHVRPNVTDADQRKFFPERFAFLDAMAREPSVDVPSGSYARLLERSDALCGRGFGNSIYEKIRITTGPKAGEEGWGCFPTDIGSSFP